MVHAPTAQRRVQLFPLKGALRLALPIVFGMGALILGSQIAMRLVTPSRSMETSDIAMVAIIPILCMVPGVVGAFLIDRRLVKARSRFLVLSDAHAVITNAAGVKLDGAPLPQLTAQEGYHIRTSGAYVGRPFHSLSLQVGGTSLIISCNAAVILAQPWGDFEASPTTAVTDEDYMFLRARLLPHRAHLNAVIQQAIHSLGRGDQAPAL